MNWRSRGKARWGSCSERALKASGAWLLLMVLVLIAASLAGCSRSSPLPQSSPTSIPTATPRSPTTTPTPPIMPRVGARAPDFTVTLLQGDSLRLADLRGKPVLINFWATWCQPCRYEMPLIQEVYQDKAYEELQIIAVDVGESRSTVEKFVTDNGYTFPIGLDSQKSVTVRYWVSAYPTTFFVDRQGIVRWVKVGAFLSRGDLDYKIRAIM